MQSKTVVVVEPSEGDISSIGATPSAIPVADAEPEVNRGTINNEIEEETGDINYFAYICFAPFIILSMPIYLMERYCCKKKEENK